MTIVLQERDVTEFTKSLRDLADEMQFTFDDEPEAQDHYNSLSDRIAVALVVLEGNRSSPRVEVIRQYHGSVA